MLRDPILTLPTSQPNDPPFVSICINDQWRAVLLSVMERLEYLTTWESGVTYDDLDISINQLYHEIVSSQGNNVGNNCCNDNTLYRFTDEGVLLVSPDGGATWSPATTQDPRTSGTILPRPQLASGATTPCQAAGNATEAIKAIIDAVIADIQGGLDIADAVMEAVILITVYLGWVSVLVGIIQQIVMSIIGFGDEAVDAAMTTAVYDRLKCNLACNTPNDGMHTAASLQAVIDQIAEDETGIARQLLTDHINMLGVVGLTNAGRVGAAAGDDCGSCGCGCTEAQNYSAVGEDWTGGVEGENGAAGNGRYLSPAQGMTATFEIPDRAGRLIASVGVNWTGATGSGGIGIDVGAQDSEEDVIPFGQPGYHNFVPSVDDDTVTITLTGTLGIHFTYIVVNYDCEV